LGWLLLAAMGDVSTVANTEADDLAIFSGVHGADTGVYSHIFQFKSTDQFFIPWLTIRRKLPHTTSTEVVGETFQDGRIAGWTLTAASGAPVMMDIDLVARMKQAASMFDYAPAWATATFDDFDKFGSTSCSGTFQIGSTTFNVIAISVAGANALLPPGQSIPIGSIHPLDFPNLGRTITVTATMLVDDWDLYVSTFVGTASTTDADATCTVYKADLNVELASDVMITGVYPYKIKIASNPFEDNVAWAVRPLRITPNRPMVVQAMATVLAVEGSLWETHPFFIVLQNAKASYALPTP